MLYSVGIGVAGAVAAIVFGSLVHWIGNLALTDWVGYHAPEPGADGTGLDFDIFEALSLGRRWLLFIIPTVGGLLSGWIVFTWAPEAEGHGTDGVIRAFHRDAGHIRPRVAVVKTVASAITIGTGGSAGKEGPIAQIAATIGSYVGDRFHLDDRERRMLLMAGVAAGIGSIFRSPLGGAFFAVEVLYREDIESEGIMPAMIAAITGYSIYSSFEDSSTVFLTPSFSFISPLELIPLIAFALVCALVGFFYTKVFYGTKDHVFDRIKIRPHFKPAIGGFLVGIIAFFFPQILGSSYGWLQQAIYGNLPITIMLVIAFAKIFATSFTISSGGSGGVFAPSLVIGGMLGGVYGQGLHQILPDLVTQPGAYVMIGMATFFTGVANVPITTAIMISEMTGSYTLLVPLIFAGVLTHLMARKWSLYTQQVRSYNDSPAHRSDLTPDLLESIKVKSIIDYPVYFHSVDPSHTLDEIMSVFARTREVILPICASVPDEQAGHDRYTGLVLLEGIQPLLEDEDVLGTAVVAADLAEPFLAVYLEDSLDQVLAVFDRTSYPELPVLNADDEIVGFIRAAQVVSEYHRAYLRRKCEDDEM
jgi:chloride channel protein, CIC family